MKNIKQNKGITLIALVITIIVLLILAGVSISMLTGENGILTQAQTSKTETTLAGAKEKIQVEVAGSYGLDGKIDVENQLNKNLKNISGLTYNDEALSDENKIESLPATVELDGYEFEINENGKIEKIDSVDYATLQSLYGKVVNGYTGYTATDVTEWKLFYVDEENKEAFIISSNTLAAPQPTSSGIPTGTYTGSENVATFEYGAKYNKLWLEKCTTECTEDYAKATAYLCDPSNWEKYKTGNAKYAAGGPTLEILVASFNNKQVKNLSTEETTITSVTETGYPYGFPSGLSGFYKPSGNWWIASPVDGGVAMVRYTAGAVISGSMISPSVGLRPIVCLPVSAIEINGEGTDATLMYK